MQTHVRSFFHLLPQNETQVMIHVFLYYKTILVSQIIFSVSGIKAVDPFGIRQTAKVCPRAMVTGLEINFGCDYGQLGGLPRKGLSDH